MRTNSPCLAAAIELEGTGIAAPTPADQLVVHAHTGFGAPRTQALDALPTLSDHGLLQMVHVGADDDARPNDTGVQIQYVSDPSLTDGIALYEARTEDRLLRSNSAASHRQCAGILRRRDRVGSLTAELTGIGVGSRTDAAIRKWIHRIPED